MNEYFPAGIFSLPLWSSHAVPLFYGKRPTPPTEPRAMVMYSYQIPEREMIYNMYYKERRQVVIEVLYDY